jgi:hypothetical protein
MTDTINNEIPFVPENTIDPAAGLNESLLIIDMLLQLRVLGMKQNTPAVSPDPGDRYIVGSSPTGAWAGQALKAAQWMQDGYWMFRPASVAVYGTSVYLFTGSDWVGNTSVDSAVWGGVTGTLSDQTDLQSALDEKEYNLTAGTNITIDRTDPAAPVISASGGGGGSADWGDIGGTLSDQEDLQEALDEKEFALTAGTGINIDRTDPDAPVISATGETAPAWGSIEGDIADQQDLQEALYDATFTPVVTESSTSRILSVTDAGAYIRHTNSSASTVTVPPDSSEDWGDGVEITIRRSAAGNLTLIAGSGVTLNEPSGGTLVMTNNMTVTLKRVGADEWDVIGQTVPA